MTTELYSLYQKCDRQDELIGDLLEAVKAMLEAAQLAIDIEPFVGPVGLAKSAIAKHTKYHAKYKERQ